MCVMRARSSYVMALCTKVSPRFLPLCGHPARSPHGSYVRGAAVVLPRPSRRGFCALGGLVVVRLRGGLGRAWRRPRRVLLTQLDSALRVGLVAAVPAQPHLPSAVPLAVCALPVCQVQLVRQVSGEGW
jgi:hypothetical protein